MHLAEIEESQKPDTGTHKKIVNRTCDELQQPIITMATMQVRRIFGVTNTRWYCARKVILTSAIAMLYQMSTT